MSDAPESRGSLTVAERVYQKLAEQAATEVVGVVRDRSAIEAVTRRSLPNAQAVVAGSRVRVHLDVAVRWPQSLPAVAAQVRSTVTGRLVELVGADVDCVDVDVTRVVVADLPPGERVR